MLPAVCPEAPSALANGTFNCSTGSVLGSNCTGTCSTGFRGSPTTTCRADGMWGAVNSSCELIGKALDACMVSMACWHFSLNERPQRCYAQPVGNPVHHVLCVWCELVSAVCPQQTPALSNGAYSCSSNRTPGSNCTGRCNSGFRGSPTITCQQDATWSSSGGTCRTIGTLNLKLSGLCAASEVMQCCKPRHT